MVDEFYLWPFLKYSCLDCNRFIFQEQIVYPCDNNFLFFLAFYLYAFVYASKDHSK